MADRRNDLNVITRLESTARASVSKAPTCALWFVVHSKAPLQRTTA